MKDFLKTFHTATNLPISYFDGMSLLEHAPENVQDFNLPMMLRSSMPEQLPDLWYSETEEHLYFGGLSVKENNHLIFFGPILLSECSTMQAETILHQIGRTKQFVPNLLESFAHFSLCTIPALLAHLQLLDFFINHESGRTPQYIPFQWKTFLPAPPPIEPDEKMENSIADERLLLSYVKYGQLEKLNHYLNENVLAKVSPIYQQPSSLSLHRSYIFTTNMTVSRLAIDVGVEYDLVDTLFIRYSDQIMNAQTHTDLTHIFINIMREYTKRVAELHQLPSSMPIVRKISSYIQAHLYEKISPSIIAEHLNMNCSYLCTQFKRETTMTIVNYIQNCKIQEAQRLMEFTEMPLVEISELLAFSSQSYFCSIFHKITGKNPKEYRDAL